MNELVRARSVTIPADGQHKATVRYAASAYQSSINSFIHSVCGRVVVGPRVVRVVRLWLWEKQISFIRSGCECLINIHTYIHTVDSRLLETNQLELASQHTLETAI